MHAYEHRKLTEAPDVGDIKEEGRRSSVGQLPTGWKRRKRKAKPLTSKQRHQRYQPEPREGKEYRSYTRSAARRKATRRRLKHADKQQTTQQIIAEVVAEHGPALDWLALH